MREHSVEGRDKGDTPEAETGSRLLEAARVGDLDRSRAVLSGADLHHATAAAGATATA